MFTHIITITPLGLLYGTMGAFLSPENLVGRSGHKFPPDATTVSGLFFNDGNKKDHRPESVRRQDVCRQTILAGPFWAKTENPQRFYVPIPRYLVAGNLDGEIVTDEWLLGQQGWERKLPDLLPEFSWMQINSWNKQSWLEGVAPIPWKYISVLHPRLELTERHVIEENGLFLENAVQMDEGTCLIYLSTQEIAPGWYRFGGESHLVEVGCEKLRETHPLHKLLATPIDKSCALITSGVWGSNRFSYRYPQGDFPEPQWMLMEKPSPFRYRIGENLSRGRYAVSAGSVYVFEQPLGYAWRDWPESWFPTEGYSLKRWGCGLALPININQGVR